ncbi:hypothetical protein [Clostridium sp. DJ247]|uniref:hypothetical protein n=1 Tax=Clostridium sp. DJ247 TaxID=2726188 RepID=UPI001628BC13|nr:hypothetical protein [Clostridium sp. DJ247]MBC2581653.1 hypothetical protein [Clostridium sp. DJ247]
MSNKSHVDLQKLDQVPLGQPFVYKDVVQDNFDDDKHTIDGRIFKEEVESGLYDSVEIDKNTGNRMLYRKL